MCIHKRMQVLDQKGSTKIRYLLSLQVKVKSIIVPTMPAEIGFNRSTFADICAISEKLPI